MKTITSFIFLIILSSCSTPDGGWSLDPSQYFIIEYAKRRAAYVGYHPELNQYNKENLLKGWPVLGMTMEQVRICRGTPHRRSSTHTQNGYSNVWIYGITAPVRHERPREYVRAGGYNGRYEPRRYDRYRREFIPTSAYFFEGGVLVGTEYYR